MATFLTLLNKANHCLILKALDKFFQSLRKKLKTLKKATKNVKLTAADAYGEVRENMFMEVPKEELAHIPQLDIGAHLRLELSGGAHIVRVTKISDSHVTLDGNHPLAGQPLEFDIEMVMIREATSEEVSHGHPHGLHGNAGHHH